MEDLPLNRPESVALVPRDESRSNCVLESVQEEVIQRVITDDSVLLGNKALSRQFSKQGVQIDVLRKRCGKLRIRRLVDGAHHGFDGAGIEVDQVVFRFQRQGRITGRARPKIPESPWEYPFVGIQVSIALSKIPLKEDRIDVLHNRV